MNKGVKGLVNISGFFLCLMGRKYKNFLIYSLFSKYLALSLLLLIFPLHVFAKDISNHDLNDFKKVEISGNLTSVLKKSSKPGLYIELGKSSSIDDLLWYVSVNTLVIKKKSVFPDFRNVKIIIYYKDNLESVIAKNRALVKTAGNLESKKILLEAVSGGILNLSVDSKKIEARSVKTSRITLKGQTDMLYVHTDSGSEFNSLDMVSKKVQAYARSGGIVRVNASKSISGSSGLGSHIYYKGSPESKVFTSGTGGELTELE